MAQDLSKWDLYTERTGHPVEQHTRVNVIVHVRRIADGEVRQYKSWEIYDAEDGDTPSDFMDAEGNYSCDCNRHLFFHRAAGVEPEDDVECGDRVLYEVNVANAKDGAVYYREFEDIPTNRDGGK